MFYKDGLEDAIFVKQYMNNCRAKMRFGKRWKGI